MITIGIYDSGIGGLTTLKLLHKRYSNCRFYYLADNYNHPFGNKSPKDIKAIVNSGVEKLKRLSNIQIIACNTASAIYNGDDVIKLHPPIEDMSDDDKNNSILLCTSHTAKEYAKHGILHANTHDLAGFIESQARISARSNTLDMQHVLPYIAKHLFEYKGVKNIILGCSHYPYCKQQISKVLRGVNFIDGNTHLIRELDNYINENEMDITIRDDVLDEINYNNFDDLCPIKFDFTGMNETKLYKKIYSLVYKADYI